MDAPTSPPKIVQPDGAWEFEHVPCDYCGSTEADELLRGPDRLHGLPGEFPVVACRGCGLIRTSPRPTAESLPTAYPAGYSPHARPPSAEPPRGLLRRALVDYRDYPLGTPRGPLLQMLMRPLALRRLNGRKGLGYVPYVGEGKLLDLGCGGGAYVARMAAAGWQAEGMDMSEEAVRNVRAAGLTAHQGTLPGAELSPASYDTVTMRHVIEHVPSPLATLRAVHDALRPGGQLLVACPQWDSASRERFGPCWYCLDLPRHLTHFSRATLARHVETAGFRVVRMVSRARPSWVRKSWARRAEASSGGAAPRRAKSRLWVGLRARSAARAGRGDEIFCLAVKRDGSG